jgi:hypothetical protein
MLKNTKSGTRPLIPLNKNQEIKNKNMLIHQVST